jgi:4-hydroxy-3-polyprenylbenzoate decarboxylase
LSNTQLDGTPLIIWVDDADFAAANLKNFLWVAFTRSNPSHDIHGIDSFNENKHWGSKGPIIIDARIKPHHAPAVELDPVILKKTDALFAKGGSLSGIL